METELILWLVAGFIISEGIFIYSMISNKRRAVLGFEPGEIKEIWGLIKLISFITGSLLTFIQFLIVYIGQITDTSLKVIFGTGHYEYILYELIVIGLITLFFFINKKIVDKINKSKTNNEKQTAK